MFQSLYRLYQNPGRIQPEAVLTGKGAFAMLMIFLGEQLAAEAIAVLIQLYRLPLGVMEINLIVNGGGLLLMLLVFGGFFLENIKSFFRVIIQVVLALVRGEFQNTSNNELVMQMLYQYPAALVLLTVIIAPITEEAVFRAALSRSMTVSGRAWVKALGFVLSIFFFAFFHVFQFVFFAIDASGAVYLTFNFNEFLSILVYIPMAVGLAVCSYFGRNYWCSVLCHMLTNGIAVFLMLFAGDAIK